MEIHSEPDRRTITVTDLDIRFPGETAQFTLYEGDTAVRSGDGLELDIHIAERDLGKGRKVLAEDLTVNLHRALWVSRRLRTVTLPADTADEPAHRKTQ